MNVEKLHRILLEVKKEYEVIELLGKLRTVRDNLQNQVNQPQQASYQQNLVSSLEELYSALTKSEFNNYSPSWNQIISEIGKGITLGTLLKEKFETIFATNQITPSAALETISTIVSAHENFKTAIDTLLTSFITLKIGAEELNAGECELGYTIPRLYVQNKLGSLNKEIGELNFILNNITEAVTGEKIDYEVKMISSSDFLFNIAVGIYVAKIISEVLEKLIDNYKKILEIKKLRNELKAVGMPAKETKGIEDYANNLMNEEIKKIAQHIMSEYPKKDLQRQNELSNGVTIALNKIANRIDNGFNIEIRVKELPQPKEKENIEEVQKENQMIKVILDNTKIMEFTKTGGQPILGLSESEEEKKVK